MLPRPSRYSLCYKLIAFGLWVPPLALVFADRVNAGLRSLLLAPLGDDACVALFMLLFVLLPALAILLHLSVWMVPPLRRRFQPPWTTHVFALIILALPGLTLYSLAQARLYTEPAQAPPSPPPFIAGPVDSSPAANPFQPLELPPPPHQPAPLPKK